jgi:hypothetical protein
MEATGLWDSHATIDLDKSGTKFFIQPIGQSIVFVNGNAVQQHILLPGDQLQLGGAEILFMLAPASPVPLRAKEALFWGLLASVLILEIYLSIVPF